MLTFTPTQVTLNEEDCKLILKCFDDYNPILTDAEKIRLVALQYEMRVVSGEIKEEKNDD